MNLKDRVKGFKKDFQMLSDLVSLKVQDYVGKPLMEFHKQLEKELGVDEVIYYDQAGNSSYLNWLYHDEEFWVTAIIVGEGRIVYDDGLQFSSDFETIYVDVKVKTSWDYELDKPKR